MAKACGSYDSASKKNNQLTIAKPLHTHESRDFEQNINEINYGQIDCLINMTKMRQPTSSLHIYEPCHEKRQHSGVQLSTFTVSY